MSDEVYDCVGCYLFREVYLLLHWALNAMRCEVEIENPIEVNDVLMKVEGFEELYLNPMKYVHPRNAEMILQLQQHMKQRLSAEEEGMRIEFALICCCCNWDSIRIQDYVLNLCDLIENKQLKLKLNQLEEDQRVVRRRRQQEISNQSHPIVALNATHDNVGGAQTNDQQAMFSSHEQGEFE